jgi:amidohydrolase
MLIPLSIQNEKDYMISIRRDLHAHPELSFQEHRTAASIAALLREIPGVSNIIEGVGRTGVTALIRGGSSGPCVLLRADMDALPITETGSCPFISQNIGVHHACGHDGHCAALLGAARVLGSRAAGMRGDVKLCFQPAEEGYGGARYMIEDGILDQTDTSPNVDYVFGAHLWTYMPIGTVGARAGAMMAGSDKFSLSVVGKGGHAAAPQSTVDAIVTASHLVTALQTVVSRSVDPLEPAVLSCCIINGGSFHNVICDRVDVSGTVRVFSEATQVVVQTRMGEICAGVGSTFGAEIAMDYVRGYPPTINSHPIQLAQLRAAAQAIVGDADKVKEDTITCGAEDFSYFLQKRPGAFFFVGAALEGQPLRPHHRSDFDFDERALDITAAIWVRLIHDLLGGGDKDF